MANRVANSSANRTQRPLANVVNLTFARERRKLRVYQERISLTMESNRRAIGRLYSSGAMFTRRGVRAARDLLLAHQNMLRVITLLGRLSEELQVPGPSIEEVNALYVELDTLLDRTSALTQRTGTYLARLGE